MLQNFPVDGFEWRKDMFRFDEAFARNYDDDSDTGYTLQVNVKYHKDLHNARSDLSFLPERKKISVKTSA